MTRPLRASGVEFLGDVPVDWEVRPAVTMARVLTSTVDKKSYDGEFPVRLCNYTDVYYGTVIADSSEFMTATASAEQVARFSVRAGDVPFTKDSETADDIGIPAYIPDDMPGVVYGYHLSIYRPLDERYGRFLRYLLESDYARTHFATKTPGVTRVGLSQATIRYFRVPAPPPSEAIAIADFLDRETAQIDAFIAKNEALIALLAERRVAAIARAVTKGVSAGGDTIASGVDWIGDVPSHWEVRPLRWTARLRTGTTPSGGDVFAESEGAPWIRPDDLDVTGAPSLTSRWLTEEGARQGRPAPAGSTLLCTLGATVGKSGWVDDPSFFNQQITALTWDGDPEFLYWCLTAARSAVAALAVGNTLPILNNSKLGDLRVPVPPLGEQGGIVAKIRDRTARIDRMIDAARRATDLARERRAALISAAVTGKISVGVDA